MTGACVTRCSKHAIIRETAATLIMPITDIIRSSDEVWADGVVPYNIMYSYVLYTRETYVFMNI